MPTILTYLCEGEADLLSDVCNGVLQFVGVLTKAWDDEGATGKWKNLLMPMS